MKNLKVLIVLLNLSLVAGCVAFNPSIPGNTLADDTLKTDAIRNIKLYDFAIGKYTPCSNYTVLNTSVVKKPSPSGVRVGRLMSGGWEEIWTIDRCGKKIKYNVSYIADGKGGTLVGVGREK